MDGIVGKTYQTYNSLPPCQEIDISCHKLSQNGDFVSKYPSSVAAILKPSFWDHMTQIFQPAPISDPGPQSSWASTWTRSLLNWLVSDFDSSSWQLNLSTAQNDFSNFRPGWWQFCWITGVKFNSIQSIIVWLLHITQLTVCAAKNLTVFVADSPRCFEWSSMAAVSRALHELSTRRIFFYWNTTTGNNSSTDGSLLR